MINRFLIKLLSGLTRPYQMLALLGVILLGGLAIKPAPISNASVPKVIAGKDLKQVQATANARVEQRQEQARQIRPENFDLGRYPITDQNEKHWRNILWTTAVVEPQEPFVATAIEQVLAMTVRSGLSNSQMRTIDMATKVGTQLYLRNPNLYASVGQKFVQTIERSPDQEWVAVSLSGLAKGGASLDQLQSLAQRVKTRFPGWSKNVFLQTTLREVAESISPSSSPPLKDLLNWTIASKQLHLYVLCQSDRNVLCQTVLKDRNGEFVRHQDGQLWSSPLLLRSIHGLGWNFVRGQTPQGIYRVEGTVPQPDDQFFRAYGQFSLVNLFVPFEPGAKQFLPGKSGSFNGSLQAYQNLLPPSWRNSWSMQQSFWAGRIGRGLFRIHGTGESPDFFSGKDKNPDSYNWNPTIGCLSALELYNEKGQLLQADMPKVLDALRMVGGKNFSGYMVVVEVSNASGRPIDLSQIEAALPGSKSKALSKIKSAAKPEAKPQKSTAKPATPKTTTQKVATAKPTAASVQLAAQPMIVTQPTVAGRIQAIEPTPPDQPSSFEEQQPDQPASTPEIRPLPVAY